MKRISFIILFIVLTTSFSNAQVLISLLLGDKLNSGKVEFGLDGGLALTDIPAAPQSSIRPAFNLGFYFDIDLNESKTLFLHTGVIVKSPMGATGLTPYSLGNADLDKLFAGGKVERHLGYFNVPFLIKYKFHKDFFVEGGPQLGLLNKGVDEFRVTIKDKNDLTYENDIEDQIKKIDAGVTVGVGCKLLHGTGITLGVRQYFGLTNILKDSNLGDHQNSAFYIYAGIRILGIKKKPEAEK